MKWSPSVWIWHWEVGFSIFEHFYFIQAIRVLSQVADNIWDDIVLQDVHLRLLIAYFSGDKLFKNLQI
jgi:hypothetical protein